MQPTQKRSSSNEILCGAPAKKVPQPPASDDDPNKSSILKAFEAVLAAGRRGLLGPTAMAAVEAVPDVDLKCEENVGQETPCSSSLVEEKSEKQMDKKKKDMTFVNKGSNIVVPLTTPVNGTGNLPKRWEPTRKEVWICGNSVVSLAMMKAQSSCHGLLLGFRYSTADIGWRGVPEMMWDDVLPILHHIYHDRRPPSIIVIHVGENDLLVDSRCSLVTRMKNDLCIIQKAFPDAVIIWSSLLPQHVWKPSENSRVVESERNNVNCKMEEYCNETDLYYLSHPLITGENKSLFSPEDILSTEGADIFITDLKKVLNVYLDHKPL